MAPTLRKMDTIFIDIKHIDPRQHHAFTGVDNALILQNIRRASDEGLPLVVRIPTIVGVNADDETMTRVFDFFEKNQIRAKLEFLPYHRYGEAKYEKLRAGAAGSPLRHAERGAARTLDSHGGSAWH